MAGNLRTSRTDYLMIAHPASPTNWRRWWRRAKAEGMRVKVVDVFDVYQAYTGGEIDPEAIHGYIKVAARDLGVRYLLLVGATATTISTTLASAR